MKPKTQRTKPAETNKQRGREPEPAQHDQQLKFDPKDVKVTTKMFRDESEDGVFGEGSFSLLGFKNPQSYAIGSDNGWLKLREDSKTIASGKLSWNTQDIRGIVYIDHLNCYLLSYIQNAIFRKGIDDSPPYQFMTLSCGYRLGGCLNYSKVHKRLIVVNDRSSISVVNLDRKRIELEIRRDQLDYNIEDLKLFGKRDNKIACLTRKGDIFCGRSPSSSRRSALRSTSKST